MKMPLNLGQARRLVSNFPRRVLLYYHRPLGLAIILLGVLAAVTALALGLFTGPARVEQPVSVRQATLAADLIDELEYWIELVQQERERTYDWGGGDAFTIEQGAR